MTLDLVCFVKASIVTFVDFLYENLTIYTCGNIEEPSPHEQDPLTFYDG